VQQDGHLEQDDGRQGDPDVICDPQGEARPQVEGAVQSTGA
jgi:hypothetical protein